MKRKVSAIMVALTVFFCLVSCKDDASVSVNVLPCETEIVSNDTLAQSKEVADLCEEDLTTIKNDALITLQTYSVTTMDSIFNDLAKDDIQAHVNLFITAINNASDAESVALLLFEGEQEIDRIVLELFETNFNVVFGNSSIATLSVRYNCKAIKPNDPIKIGQTFTGWYTSETFESEYNFDNPVFENQTIYAKWEETIIIGENGVVTGSTGLDSGRIITQGDVWLLNCSGMNEGAYVEFRRTAGIKYLVYLKAPTDATYRLLDEKVAYQSLVSSTVMRVDLLGLCSGDYSIKIVPSESYIKESICTVRVTAYDRSGYAHFNYNEGVGAYNDDGTLKENAIVIYVTEENKNSVMRTIPQLEEYMFNIPGTDWGGKQASGIGWWLNNAQYTKASKNSSGTINLSKTSNTYSSTGKTLGFYSVTEEHPIAIRFVGTVTTPEGCTGYDSYAEGGSEGDNGHMARMKDIKNITLEGVGSDAIIKGWGFHFMTSDTAGQRGKNFEVRNLTFTEYPEDALGMEGEQDDSSKTLKAPVQRCWVHHCTFLPGYCANPAESDKTEGDGSCDFKRGEYFTMSYCYYEYCHKTNLLGSSDSSLQYNISYHHNVWYNCGSRIPLLRTANIHFYNNYIYSDITDSKAELSYVTSLRANCYMYAENNYYEGCKQVFDSKNGGTAKCYGNTYLGCFSSDSVSNYIVNSRTEGVEGNCSYKDINYQNFDTNNELFYYNNDTKSSDCYLTSSTVAREECLKYSGSAYRTVLNKTSLTCSNTASNKYNVDGNIDLSSGSYTATIGTNAPGIVYNNVNNGKFRGQGITFKLNDCAKVTISMTYSSSGMYAGYIVSSVGEVMLSGSGTVTLKPGTYYVMSTSTDKDTTVTSLKFEKDNSEDFEQNKIEEFNALVAQIPNTITFDDSCYNKIKNALDYYSALSEELKTKVDVSIAEDGLQRYIALGIIKIEELIFAIGTVNETSENAISIARATYEALTAIAGSITVSNYNILLQAETQFKQFAIQSCIAKIDAIGMVSLSSEEAILVARNEYDFLSLEQKALITNYATLLNAEAEFASLVKINTCELAIAHTDITSIINMKNTLELYSDLTSNQKAAITNTSKLSQIKVSYTIALINSIGNVTSESENTITLAENNYDALSEVEKSEVTNISTLQAARLAYEKLISNGKSMDFSNGISNDYFAISGNTSTTKGSNTFNGITYSKCLKIESSTSIAFTTTTASTLTLVLGSGEAGKRILVDGTSYVANANGVVTVELQAGSHLIKKVDVANLFFIQLS